MLEILYRDLWIIFNNILYLLPVISLEKISNLSYPLHHLTPLSPITYELLPSLKRRSISGISVARLPFSRLSIDDEIDIFPINLRRKKTSM